VNRPVNEIRRLRAALSKKDAQIAEKDARYAELAALVQTHLEATKDDDAKALQREREAFERGEVSGSEWSYRRGIEHALVAVEDAHLAGSAHDRNGQMKDLGLHSGPVPPIKTDDEVVADAEDYARRAADWWWRESQRSDLHCRPAKTSHIELEAG